jgi:hypothetical protein
MKLWNGRGHREIGEPVVYFSTELLVLEKQPWLIRHWKRLDTVLWNGTPPNIGIVPLWKNHCYRS